VAITLASASKPLEALAYFILKYSKNPAISARLDKLLTIISTILKGMGINYRFLFLSKKKDHVIYYLHNS
jgi:hypothetical protein